MKKGTVIATTFDKYTVIKEVGSGGNGHVFSAKTADGDMVAIKFVPRNIPTNKLKRFKNEIFFCERHDHKNIVKILDRGTITVEDIDYVFYVMPLYAETLRTKMKSHVSPEQALVIFTGLLEGLSYAHKAGTIHRDIKPENIMFKAGSDEPIICDFGIAHFAEDELLTVVETKKSDRMANFQYAAPEQRVRGSQVSEQTDIYAVALILNEMFTGEIPQAAGYKTIASIDPEYTFLDEVFSLLYQQNPKDRLYPEEKILMETKVRAERHKRDKEKKHLQEVVAAAVNPDSFEAVVTKKEYSNGSLVFTFNKALPAEWFQILTVGNIGNYTSLISYPRENLRKKDRCTISMPLHGHESNDTIKKIVEYILDWVTKTNVQYSVYLKTVAEQTQREAEAQRRKEIERLEKENAINDILSRI